MAAVMLGRGMWHRVALRAMFALALLSGAIVWGPQPAFAENSCLYFAPHTAADVRGYAWTGTVVRDEALAPPDYTGFQRGMVVFAVDHVLANAGPGRTPALDIPFDQQLTAGHRLRVKTSSCVGPIDLGMRVGERYLVSTSEFFVDVLVPAQAAAWHLHGQQAQLVDMYPEEMPAGALRRVETLQAAIALVQADLPPTDAGGGGTTPPASGLSPVDWVVLGGAVLLGLVAALLFSRRRRVEPPDKP